MESAALPAPVESGGTEGSPVQAARQPIRGIDLRNRAFPTVQRGEGFRPAS
jgi:hypothetical protein